MKFDEGEPRVSISLSSHYVIGCAYHSQSVQIGLFKQKQTGKERKWLHVCDAGTRDEPLRRGVNRGMQIR